MNASPRPHAITNSPLHFLLIIAAFVFVAEAIIMLVLSHLPRQSVLIETVLDASLLVALTTRVLYFFLFRPMLAHLEERTRVEEILHRNEEEQFRAMIRTSLDGFWIIDMRGRFIEVNDAYCRLVGHSRDELLRMGIPDVEAIETPEDTARHIEDVKDAGYARFETRHRTRDGRVLDIEVSANYTAAGGDFRIYCFLRDITERKRSQAILRESEARLKEMFENLSSGVAVCRASKNGLDFTFTAFNKAAERIENLRRSDVIGKKAIEVFPQIGESGLLGALQSAWKSGDPVRLPSSLYENGRITGWRENYVYKLSNDEVVVIYDDVTQAKQTEEMMRRLAHYDPLTDLPNRTLFTDCLRRVLAQCQRNYEQVALMFIDLDNFKPINDNFGHEVGDLLLKEVAKRLTGCIRASDTASRLGGDEFIVLLQGVSGEPEALIVANNVLSSLNQPFELAGHTLHLSSSIGIAVYPDHGIDEKVLLKHADVAMYDAKSAGRNCVRFYQPA